MTEQFDVQPLSHITRKRTFFFLVFVFLFSLPFLYLYATGYRFDFAKPTNLISTGGMYVSVERSGAEIFIDGELVRETRTFKKAFYAQNLDAGTHRVHVQKEGYHTWVKELPVSRHLVTEAEAFNLPLVPQVRIISPWQSATGTTMVTTSLLNASTTNTVLATTTLASSTMRKNPEYETKLNFFVEATSTEKVPETTREHLKDILSTGTTSALDSDIEAEEATSTITYGGVELARAGEEVFARWVGPFEQMPYYYCAPEFPPYSTSTGTSTDVNTKTSFENDMPVDDEDDASAEGGGFVMHPVQTISKDTICDARIRIDRKWQEVRDFDFYPGSTDFVVLALTDGIYVVEVDDRSWQNVQPLIMGDMLSFYIENGTIYVYDGALIYQILLQSE